MKISNTMLTLICTALAICAGCSSTPSALDQYMAANSEANSNAVAAEVQAEIEQNTDSLKPQRYVNAVRPHSSDQLEQMLRSDSVSVRVAACKQLGKIASQNEGDLEAIERLTDVLQTEKSLEVRMAATSALGAIHNEPDGDRLAAMVPEEELPRPPITERVSLLKRFWR